MLLTNHCHDLIPRPVHDFPEVVTPRMYFISSVPLLQYPCHINTGVPLYDDVPVISRGHKAPTKLGSQAFNTSSPKIKQKVAVRHQPYRKMERIESEAFAAETSGKKSPILLQLLQSPNEGGKCKSKAKSKENYEPGAAKLSLSPAEEAFGFVGENLQRTFQFFHSIPLIGETGSWKSKELFQSLWAEIFVIFCTQNGFPMEAIEKSLASRYTTMDSVRSRRDILKIRDFVRRCRDMDLTSFEYDYLRGAVLCSKGGFVTDFVSPNCGNVRSTQISLSLLTLRAVSSQSISDIFLCPVFGPSDIKRIHSGDVMQQFQQ
nr:uncharacterized protein LOC100187213 [Ciona intestinalis]|eukprot:XP_002130225.1 uncharacterized protein LOC100187213 [Ciona intestinalis]